LEIDQSSHQPVDPVEKFNLEAGALDFGRRHVHTAEEGGPETSDDAKGDPDVWKWVKNVAGIAAIVVTLSGAATGVYKLYLEFVSDRDSHEIAKAAEERQLKLGQAQIEHRSSNTKFKVSSMKMMREQRI
jgi:hypothetical protein